jgi:hypothetical protein
MVNAGKSGKGQGGERQLFGFPGTRIWSSSFDQDYSSNNLKNQMRKRQY